MQKMIYVLEKGKKKALEFFNFDGVFENLFLFHLVVWALYSYYWRYDDLKFKK